MTKLTCTHEGVRSSFCKIQLHALLHMILEKSSKYGTQILHVLKLLYFNVDKEIHKKLRYQCLI